MNPQPLFCSNRACPSRGRSGTSHIIVHQSLTDRYLCTDCGQTFVARKGSLFYRLQTDPKIVVQVLTLLSFGCPPAAIVRAFELDARTVARWQRKAGEHCQRLHEALVLASPRDLQHVQADEIRVKMQGRLIVWMAMALQVPTRLWLGGVVGLKRDNPLIRALAAQVKACAAFAPILLVSDGLVHYVSAWRRAFRTPLRTGEQRRPSLIAWPAVYIVQVIKQKKGGWVIGVRRRRRQGTRSQVRALMPEGQVPNTAYIERLNATFRQRLVTLVRRGRRLARQASTLSAGMYLVGCIYNFCTFHQSLTQRSPQGPGRARTPAMAAGITPVCWSVRELFEYRFAPPPLPPKRRRRNNPHAPQRKPMGAAK